MRFNRKVMAYTAAGAAVAAGGAKSAEATIIASPGFSFAAGSTNNIDFDHNGTEEYQLGNLTGPPKVQLLKDGNALSTNGYAATGSSAPPSALAHGTLIGPGLTYSTSYAADLLNPSGPDGNFSVDPTGTNPQYLGLQFQLTSGGPTYYGWAGVDITNPNDLSGVVTGYAYDDSGNAIAAGDTGTSSVPEPASLALLAVGSAFLLRRSRSRA